MNRQFKMTHVYIVIDNGDPYPTAYTSFASAAAEVKEVHKEAIEEQMLEADGEGICSDIDVPEDKLTGTTYLYVEKGINIYIYKLPILYDSPTN